MLPSEFLLQGSVEDRITEVLGEMGGDCGGPAGESQSRACLVVKSLAYSAAGSVGFNGRRTSQQSTGVVQPTFKNGKIVLKNAGTPSSIG